MARPHVKHGPVNTTEEKTDPGGLTVLLTVPTHAHHTHSTKQTKCHIHKMDLESRETFDLKKKKNTNIT